MYSERDLVRCEYLIVRCRLGEADAATELIRLFNGPLLFFLRRLTRSEEDAWDALQDAWLSVFRSLRSLRDPRAFPAFLYRVARNEALAILRKRESLITPLQELDVLAEATQPEATFTVDDVEEVRQALDELPLTHREVLALSFLEDLSVSEVSEVLGIPVGTVKSRVFHAKRALRRLLDQRHR